MTLAMYLLAPEAESASTLMVESRENGGEEIHHHVYIKYNINCKI